VKLTTQQAAGHLKRSRSTIWRAIKNGKLSAERSEAGDYLVEVSELERWSAGLSSQRDTSRDVAAKPSETTDETNRNNDLAIELATLRERTAQQERMLDELRAERDRLIEDRDRWRGQAETTTRLLSDQRPFRPWWRRLIG
jgi:excisionase family DNA binding protein